MIRLNKLKIFENYFQQFYNENKDLINIMNNNPILLPEPYRDPNYKKMCLPQGKVIVQGRYCQTYITSQELACAKLYIQGFSLKKIALILEISARTVETYLIRIKQRTGFSERFEIEKMLNYVCQ